VNQAMFTIHGGNRGPQRCAWGKLVRTMVTKNKAQKKKN